MFLFKKRHTAEQLGNDMATLARDYRRGALSRDKYVERASQIIAELGVAMTKVMRFGADDLVTFASCLDRLDPPDKLFACTELVQYLRTVTEDRDRNAAYRYAMLLFAVEIVKLAMAEAARMNEQKRWDESLEYCRQAEAVVRYLPRPEPVLCLIMGDALIALQRHSDAYQAFMRCVGDTERVLSDPQLNLDDTMRERVRSNANYACATANQLASRPGVKQPLKSGAILTLPARPPELSPDVRTFLQGILEEAGQTLMAEVCPEILQEMAVQLDKFVQAAILNALPAKHRQQFMALEECNASAREREDFVRRHLPHAEEVLKKALMDYRDLYLSFVAEHRARPS